MTTRNDQSISINLPGGPLDELARKSRARRMSNQDLMLSSINTLNQTQNAVVFDRKGEGQGIQLRNMSNDVQASI